MKKSLYWVSESDLKFGTIENYFFTLLFPISKTHGKLNFSQRPDILTGHPVIAKIISLFFNNFQVPDEILDDESIETTMKSKTDDEVKFEDEIETTMMPMIDDDMVSTYTLHSRYHSKNFSNFYIKW